MNNSRALLAAVLTLIAVMSAVWLWKKYEGFAEHARTQARKQPFSEAAALALADANEALMDKGLVIRDRNAPPRAACGLRTECGRGLIKSYAFEGDGSVRVVFGAERMAELDGRVLILKPAISNRRATWSCFTDVPARFIVSPEDNLPGLSMPEIAHCRAMK